MGRATPLASARQSPSDTAHPVRPVGFSRSTRCGEEFGNLTRYLRTRIRSMLGSNWVVQNTLNEQGSDTRSAFLRGAAVEKPDVPHKTQDGRFRSRNCEKKVRGPRSNYALGDRGSCAMPQGANESVLIGSKRHLPQPMCLVTEFGESNSTQYARADVVK